MRLRCHALRGAPARAATREYTAALSSLLHHSSQRGAGHNAALATARRWPRSSSLLAFGPPRRAAVSTTLCCTIHGTAGVGAPDAVPEWFAAFADQPLSEPTLRALKQTLELEYMTEIQANIDEGGAVITPDPALMRTGI